jgi:hypothetical protein
MRKIKKVYEKNLENAAHSTFRRLKCDQQKYSIAIEFLLDSLKVCKLDDYSWT